ncbi:hypothetical protein FALCPG4_001594 [Fusarium falciforme]
MDVMDADDVVGLHHTAQHKAQPPFTRRKLWGEDGFWTPAAGGRAAAGVGRRLSLKGLGVASLQAVIGQKTPGELWELDVSVQA